MAKKEEDILKANTGAPAANIPDLKKKEKERKKAGAAWSGARGASGEFSGATGGNVARAAASAAGGIGEGVAELAGAEGGGFFARMFASVAEFFAGIAESLGMGEFWAAITSSALGRMAIAAAAFLLVAAAGLLGYALMKGSGKDGLGTPDLGAISDSMRVRSGGDDRLGVNGNGELRFDPLTAAKPAAAPPPADAKAADEKPAPDVKADEDASKPVPSGMLAHNLSGAQLSSSLGGDFGSKNIFAGNSNAPKFGAGAAGLKKYPGAAGKLGTMKASTAKATPSARSVNKGSANKAFGQLRLAKGLSNQGAGASTAEQAAADSQGAFDQQQPVGGGLNTSGAPGGDTPPALGGGAPDTTVPTCDPTTDPSCSPTGGGTNPGLQNAISQISALADKAAADIQSGTMMMMMGGILIGIGAALLFWPMIAVGLALIAAGTALVMAGMAKVAQGKAEAQQAIAMGQQLANNIDNQQQGAAINECTMKATQPPYPSVESCQPSEQVTNNTNQSAADSSDIQKVHQIPVGTANIATQTK